MFSTTSKKLSPELYNLVCYFMQKAKEENVYISPMKLQKLVYYSWVRSLTFLDTEPFPETIEAWDKGPVIPNLWIEGKFYDLFEKEVYDCDMSSFNRLSMTIIEQVWSYYSNLPAEKLSDLTHTEAPWREARKAHVTKYGKRSVKCTQKIDKGNVKEFYAKLNEYMPIIDTFYLDEARDAEEAEEYIKEGKLVFN